MQRNIENDWTSNLEYSDSFDFEMLQLSYVSYRFCSLVKITVGFQTQKNDCTRLTLN